MRKIFILNNRKNDILLDVSILREKSNQVCFGYNLTQTNNICYFLQNFQYNNEPLI
jgi:hypothetical protein